MKIFAITYILASLVLGFAGSASAQQFPLPEAGKLPGALPKVLPGGAPGLKQCADEGGNCSFSGAYSIAYGANDVFAYKVAVGGIPCNNSVFGDPVPGAPKKCYQAGDALTQCAAENGHCAFTGSRTVAYGARSNFAYKTVENGVDCNNGVFGDPLVGTVKACYIVPYGLAPGGK